jgi:hypothetical protein
MKIEISHFSRGDVSADGTTVVFDAVDTSGATHTVQMPFHQLDWIYQASATLAALAYDRQVETGRLQAANPVDPALVAEAFRVLPNVNDQKAIVQLTGRSQPNGPVEMGSFVLAAKLVLRLSERLREAGEQLRQGEKKN